MIEGYPLGDVAYDVSRGGNAHTAIDYIIALTDLVGKQNVGAMIDPSSLGLGEEYIKQPENPLQRLFGRAPTMQPITGKTVGGRDVTMEAPKPLGMNPGEQVLRDFLHKILMNPQFGDTLRTGGR